MRQETRILEIGYRAAEAEADEAAGCGPFLDYRVALDPFFDARWTVEITATGGFVYAAAEDQDRDRIIGPSRGE